MLRMKGSAEHSRCTDLHALLINNFEHNRVLRIESTAVQRCAHKSTEIEKKNENRERWDVPY